MTPLRALFSTSLVISLVAFGLYALQTWVKVRETADAELHLIDRLLVRTTDDIFSHNESMLRVLGERLLEVDTGSYPEHGRQLIEQILRINPQMAGFGLARSDGQLILVSGIETGKILPNLMTRPESSSSFAEALNHDGMSIGRTYYLPLLERWVVPLRVAIRDSEGHTPLVMTSGVDLDSPHSTWNGLQLPRGMEARVLRKDGYWQFVQPLDPAGRNTFFDDPADRDWVKAIHNGYRDPDEPHHYHTFELQGRIGIGSYMENWNLYTLVSVPEMQLYAAWGKQMLIPFVLLASLLTGGLLLYRSLHRQQMDYEARLIEQAHYDELTGLPNRVLVMDRLQHALDSAVRNASQVMLLFVDLDHFKRINDSFGHMVGDQLLAQCARRFRKVMRAGDTVGRLGGDEFLVVLPDTESLESIESVVHKIQAVVGAEPFTLGHRKLFNTCSIGLAVYPGDGDNAQQLLRAADTALYKAKAAGRNTHRFFAHRMNEEAERQMELESALRYALDNDELSLVYQPQVDLESQRWVGCEALLRWNNPLLGEVSPVEFIPVAEESGLISAIGDYVLRRSCADLSAIQSVEPDFNMAINLSPVQLHHDELPGMLAELLNESGLRASSLELEITESAMVENSDQLDRLHALGATIAVDDFGTGFSSLGYLQRFPVSTLKIDRSFVMNIEHERQQARLIDAIVNLGINLQLGIVAEGIENHEQLDYLRRCGCRLGQGYFFSKPLTLQSLLECLEQRVLT